MVWTFFHRVWIIQYYSLCGHFSWSVDIFCRLRIFCEGVVTTVSVEIFVLSVDTFSQGVVTTVSVDIFYEVWTFFVECGHFLWSVDISCGVWTFLVGCDHYKCGHFCGV